MSTCRCTATKHATSGLPRLEPQVREEIGWGDEFDGERFNRFMDGFRTIFYLRRGAPLSGYGDVKALHRAELSDVVSYEEFSLLPDAEAAVLLYRSRRSKE